MTAGRIVIAIAAAALLGSGCGGEDKPKGKPLEAARGTVREADFGKRTVRVRGLSPTDVAGAAVLAAYPGDDIQPNGIVLARTDRWREVLLSAQFAAPPVSAAILPRRRDYLPTATADLVDRLNLRGFPLAKGLKAVVMGEAGDEVFASLQEKDLELTQLKARSPERLSFDVVPFRGGWAHAYSDQIVIVSSRDRDRGHALPGAAWSAYSGDTLAFVGRDSVPAKTRELLVQRRKLRLESPKLYVIGPRSVISDAVTQELSQYGRITRLAGDSPAGTAVAIARFHDRATGFGWGVRSGPANLSFVNPRDWGNAVAAFNFAGAGPQAPLLLTRPDGSLPPVVSAYLRSASSPRGNQAFVLGDERSIPQATLTEIDRLVAPGPARGAAGRTSKAPASPTPTAQAAGGGLSTQ